MKLALLRAGDEAKYFLRYVRLNKIPVAAFVVGAIGTVWVGAELIMNYPPKLVITEE
jgi:hypothetical protein